MWVVKFFFLPAAIAYLEQVDLERGEAVLVASPAAAKKFDTKESAISAATIALECPHFSEGLKDSLHGVTFRQLDFEMQVKYNGRIIRNGQEGPTAEPQHPNSGAA